MSEVVVGSSSAGSSLRHSPKQLAVLQLGLDPSVEAIFLNGAIGSSKSSIACQLVSFFWKSPECKPGGTTVFIGKTVASVHSNLIETFRDASVFGELAYSVRVPKLATDFTIFGERCRIISGADAHSAAEKLQGANVKAIIVDEAATLDFELFDQAIGRLRHGDHTKLIVTFNPRNPKHWLKAKFIDKIGDAENPGELYHLGWRHVQMWMGDNPGLSERYKNTQRTARDPKSKEYARDICGLWTADDGLVYSSFDEKRNVVARGELPPMARLLAVGMDYGDTSPSGAVLLGVDEEFEKLWVIDEFGNDGAADGHMAPTELVGRLAAWLNSIELPNQEWVPPVENVWIDPGGGGTPFISQVLAEPCMRAYRVGPVSKKPGSVIDGVRTIQSLLWTGRLVIADSCTNLLDEFLAYTYDAEASERRGETVIKKGNDHYLDAMRYAVFTTRGAWRPWFNNAVVDSLEEVPSTVVDEDW